jgi:hypothetical protein
MQTVLCRAICCASFALAICLLAAADEPSPQLMSGGEALHVPPIVDPLRDQRPERVAVGRYHHFFFDEERPLDLNLERLAILRPEGQAPIVPASLAAIGVGDADLEAFPIEGWSLAELPDVVRAACDVETLVAASAQDAGVEFVSPVFVGDDGGPVFVTPDILVAFHRHVGAAQAEAVLAAAGAGEITDVDWGGMPGAYRLRSGASNGFEGVAAGNGLAGRHEVRFGEPDMIFTGHGTGFPNDLGFGNCWGLHNVGFAPDMDMDAPQAWDVTIGDPSIIVVIIDTGVQQDHPDLNQISGTDTTSQGPGDGGPVNACDNHGTRVAGCVSAHIDNGIGTVGVAPGCVSASARTFISNLSCNGSWSSTASWTVDTLTWAETTRQRHGALRIRRQQRERLLQLSGESAHGERLRGAEPMGQSGLVQQLRILHHLQRARRLDLHDRPHGSRWGHHGRLRLRQWHLVCVTVLCGGRGSDPLAEPGPRRRQRRVQDDDHRHGPRGPRQGRCLRLGIRQCLGRPVGIRRRDLRGRRRGLSQRSRRARL